MQSKYPIFIPSCGRADIARVPMLLASQGVPHNIVVEPQEVEEYKKGFPKSNILALPLGKQGIVYSRQWILDYARANGYKKYWQIDDNILAFYKVISGHVYQVPPMNAIRFIENITETMHDVALAATDYQQYAWRNESEYTENRRALCCVLTRTDTGMNYTKGTDMKEDIDFVLQHLHAGYKTLLVHKYAMGKPTMGMNKKGGLSVSYRSGKATEQAKKVVALWSQYCSLVSKGDRGMDIKINWKKFQ